MTEPVAPEVNLLDLDELQAKVEHIAALPGHVMTMRTSVALALIAEIRVLRELLDAWEDFGANITGCTNHSGRVALEDAKSQLDTHIRVKAEMLRADATKLSQVGVVTRDTTTLRYAARKARARMRMAYGDSRPEYRHIDLLADELLTEARKIEARGAAAKPPAGVEVTEALAALERAWVDPGTSQVVLSLADMNAIRSALEKCQ